MILQYIYRPILNYIYGTFTCKIKEGHRYKIILCTFLITFLSHLFTTYKFDWQLSHAARDIIMCTALVVCIIMSVNKRLDFVEWNKRIYIPYIITFLFILIAGFFQYMGHLYVVFPWVMLFGFTGLYYVWGNRGDYEILFDIVAKAYIIFTGLLLMVCLIKHPYVFGESYSVLGIYPNEYAKFMVPGLVSWIYLAIRNHKNKYHWISLIGIGMFICVVFANGSRSGILSAIFIILVGIFFYYRTLKMNCETGDGRRMALRKTAVAILICFTTAIGTLGFIYIVTPYLDNTLSVEVFAETTENTKEDENPYVPGSLEYMSFEGEKLIDDHEFLIELDKISTGRIWIWSAYLNNITWKGQNTPIYSYGPHNQFVEFSYNAGLLTGIIWLICVLTIGGTLIYRGFSKKQTTVYFPIMMYLTYFIFTMLDTGVAPFGKTHIYLFFITLIAVMTDKKERVTVEDISTGKLDNK